MAPEFDDRFYSLIGQIVVTLLSVRLVSKPWWASFEVE
jgi:hypothetical protein